MPRIETINLPSCKKKKTATKQKTKGRDALRPTKRENFADLLEGLGIKQVYAQEDVEC